MKKIVAVICVILAAAVLWRYRFLLIAVTQKFPELAGSPVVAQLKKDILTPPPLIGDLTSPRAHLTAGGVIAQTNIQRAANGNLTNLAESQALDRAAQLKLQDMFSQQYFEHENPQGKGPEYLAESVSYSYVAIGENLALGNFKDDTALVDAWMNSPGHRENILNPKYTQIGVAVGRGTFQGHATWLAVQEFGRPSSDCPAVNNDLKNEISSLQSEIKDDRALLASQKNWLETNTPQSPGAADAYNARVDQYNSLVKTYNARVESLQQQVNSYNSQVNAFNACVGN